MSSFWSEDEAAELRARLEGDALRAWREAEAWLSRAARDTASGGDLDRRSAELLQRWVVLFEDELAMLKVVSNAVAHGVPIGTDDLRDATHAGRQVLALLRLRLGMDDPDHSTV
jgi:hypothetical protein